MGSSGNLKGKSTMTRAEREIIYQKLTCFPKQVTSSSRRIHKEAIGLSRVKQRSTKDNL